MGHEIFVPDKIATPPYPCDLTVESAQQYQFVAHETSAEEDAIRAKATEEFIQKYGLHPTSG